MFHIIQVCLYEPSYPTIANTLTKASSFSRHQAGASVSFEHISSFSFLQIQNTDLYLHRLLSQITGGVGGGGAPDIQRVSQITGVGGCSS